MIDSLLHVLKFTLISTQSLRSGLPQRPATHGAQTVVGSSTPPWGVSSVAFLLHQDVCIEQGLGVTWLDLHLRTAAAQSRHCLL